jgi:putative transposase
MKTPTHEGDYLKRLQPEFYRGQACVHWTLTIADRKTGWLTPVFLYKFRELLTHTMFRYGACCPIYCLMPDHMHLLWLGILKSSDQLLAMKYLRSQLRPVLKKHDVELQTQAFDHVLRDDERQPAAFQNIAEYIARNPEREGLMPVDGFREYAFSGCLIPGYPDLSPFQPKFWELFDRLCSMMRHQGLILTERNGAGEQTAQ